MKKLVIISIIVVFISILVIPATLFADTVEKVDAFVCPVLNATVGAHNPNAKPIGEGDYTLFPGKAAGDPGTHLNSPVSVPENATNDNGNGTPPDHAKPGENGYSPIWSLGTP